MICPKCGENDDKVLDSRPTDDGFAVRRRRVCLVCGARFSTIEKIEGLKPMVVKKDGSKQLYDPDKILRNLDVACQKRGVSQQVKENICSDITHLVDERFNKEITSSEIGEFIMSKLMDIDRVSYVRFASVYKNFTDLDSYTAEINNFDVGSVSSGEDKGL